MESRCPGMHIAFAALGYAFLVFVGGYLRHSYNFLKLDLFLKFNGYVRYVSMFSMIHEVIDNGTEF